MLDLEQELAEAEANKKTYLEKHKAYVQEVSARMVQIRAELNGIGRPSQRNIITATQGGRVMRFAEPSKK